MNRQQLYDRIGKLDIEQRAQLMDFMFGWAMAQNDEIPQKAFFDRPFDLNVRFIYFPRIVRSLEMSVNSLL